MLDHDPVKAAEYLCDKHVMAMPFVMAALLASAWHSLDSEWSAPLETPKGTPWIGWLVHPSSNAQDRAGKPYTTRKAMFPGEPGDVEWSLFKQRIPAPLKWTHRPEEEWVAALGGNYNWLWQHAAATTSQHLQRFGARHPATPAIWTLEVIPWSLRATADEWSETPLGIPHHMRVAEDGFYDTVASNRRWYNIMIPDDWTGPAPDWHEKEHQLSIDN